MRMTSLVAAQHPIKEGNRTMDSTTIKFKELSLPVNSERPLIKAEVNSTEGSQFQKFENTYQLTRGIQCHWRSTLDIYSCSPPIEKNHTPENAGLG
jgi:hypothetical protein